MPKVDLNKLADEVYNKLKRFFMFSSPDSSERTDLSHIPNSPDSGGHAFTLIYASSLKIFTFLEYGRLITAEKIPSTFTKPKMQQHATSILTVYSACSQSDYSRVLY